MLWLVWRARLQKGTIGQMLPVTVRLGENVAGALNALVPVAASDGGRRPRARGL